MKAKLTIKGKKKKKIAVKNCKQISSVSCIFRDFLKINNLDYRNTNVILVIIFTMFQPI